MAAAPGVAPDRVMLAAADALAPAARDGLRADARGAGAVRPVAQIIGAGRSGGGISRSAARSSTRGRRPRRWWRWRLRGRRRRAARSRDRQRRDPGDAAGRVAGGGGRRHRHRPGGAGGGGGECGAAWGGGAGEIPTGRLDDGIAGRSTWWCRIRPMSPLGDRGLAPDVRDWEPRHALTAGADRARELPAASRRGSPRCWRRRPGALRDRRRARRGGGGALSRRGFARAAVHPDLDGRDRVVEVAGERRFFACHSRRDAYILVVIPPRSSEFNPCDTGRIRHVH